MPAPVYAADVADATGGGGTASETVDVTSLALADGDTLVIAVGWRGTGTVTPSQAGWTEHDDVTSTTGTGPTLALYSRVKAPGDPTSYTFTLSTGTASRTACAAMKITGVGSIEVADAAPSAGSTTTPTAPDGTSGGADRLAIRIWTWSHTDSVTGYPPAGYTDELQVLSGGAAAGHVQTRVARLNVGAGAVGTLVGATLGTARGWCAATIIVAPAASTVDGTLDLVLPALAATFAGELPTEGALDVVLPALSATFAGDVVVPVDGTLDVVLPALDATFTGEAIAAGAMDVTLPALDATFTGELLAAGAMDVTLPALDVTITGDVVGAGVGGTLDVVLPALDVTFAGDVVPPVEGALDVTLPALQALFAGAVEEVDLMTLLGEAAEWIRDQIKAQGVRAVLDLEDVNPPCAFIVLDTVEHRFLASDPYFAQWHVFLVVQKQRMVDTYNALDELHGAVRTEFQSSTPVESVPLQLKGGGDPSPALHMTVRVRVT